MTSHASAEADGAGRHFTTTRWSLILLLSRGIQTKTRQARRLPNFAEFIGAQFLPSFAEKGIRSPTRRI